MGGERPRRRFFRREFSLSRLFSLSSLSRNALHTHDHTHHGPRHRRRPRAPRRAHRVGGRGACVWRGRFVVV